MLQRNIKQNTSNLWAPLAQGQRASRNAGNYSWNYLICLCKITNHVFSLLQTSLLAPDSMKDVCFSAYRPDVWLVANTQEVHTFASICLHNALTKVIHSYILRVLSGSVLAPWGSGAGKKLSFWKDEMLINGFLFFLCFMAPIYVVCVLVFGYMFEFVCVVSITCMSLFMCE